LLVSYSVVNESDIFRRTVRRRRRPRRARFPLAFEFDHVDDAGHMGWSVLAGGPVPRIADAQERELIKRIWEPRPVGRRFLRLYVRLEWTELTGRRLGGGWTRESELPVRRHL